MSSLQEAERRAVELAKRFVPVIAAELIRKPEPRPLSAEEAAIMAACGELGRALDRYDAVRFTYPAAERRARATLDLAARNIRKLIDLREAKYGRK